MGMLMKCIRIGVHLLSRPIGIDILSSLRKQLMKDHELV